MIVSRFLDIKNDVAFKRIFGTEKNKDILIHFLNDMIKFKNNSTIQDVTFLKTVQDPEIAARKTSIVDILCKDECGHSYIIEIQVAKEKGFEKRAQYYAAKAYTSQAQIGGQYHNLKEVIFLAITDFIMFPNKQDYLCDHIILDKKSYEHDLKDFSFTFIELPKFNKTIDQLTTLEHKWCYFLKHAAETSADDYKKLIADNQSQIIERAYSELERFSWNEDDMRIYDQAEKYEGIRQSTLEQKFDEGLEKGLQQGKTEGEKTASLIIARNLLKRGMELHEVAQITFLSIEELVSIKDIK